MIKEINFSKKAVERINALLAQKPVGTFFRIAVKGGGCSGFKYDFSFDSKFEENDLRNFKMLPKTIWDSICQLFIPKPIFNRF